MGSMRPVLTVMHVAAAMTPAAERRELRPGEWAKGYTLAGDTDVAALIVACLSVVNVDAEDAMKSIMNSCPIDLVVTAASLAEIELGLVRRELDSVQERSEELMPVAETIAAQLNELDSGTKRAVFLEGLVAAAMDWLRLFKSGKAGESDLLSAWEEFMDRVERAQRGDRTAFLDEDGEEREKAEIPLNFWKGLKQQSKRSRQCYEQLLHAGSTISESAPCQDLICPLSSPL